MVNAPNFKGLITPVSEKPKSQSSKGDPIIGHFDSGIAAIIRDQLTLSSWLALGAIVQGILVLVIGRLSLLLPATLLGWRILEAYLQAQGIKPNPYMDDVIMNKFSAQIPTEEGSFGNKPANGEINVLLLGFKSNHPLQALAPGFRETGDHFNKMMKDLNEHKEEFGLLGASTWLGAGERSTSNEVMTVFYFKTLDDIHNFAMGKVHRDGWNWWNKTIKEHPHLSIWHEVFRATSGNWESIYVNSAPTGLSATAFKGISEETGEEVWHSPIVDARKGLLKTSAGRMSRSQAHEHDNFEDPYENYA